MINLNRFFKTLARSAVVCGILSAIIISSACGTQRVQTVVNETEANEILNVLLENGIKASKVEVGEGVKRVYEIHISGGEDDFAAAIQLMEDHCVPQPMPAEIESSGIVSSLEVEKSREIRRIKINIESQLRNLPGATCVDVNLVQPEDKSLSLNPYTASATVLIKYKTEKFGLDTRQVARMVAGSVPGLTADNVFVTLSRQPLRPLPNNDSGQNIRRLLWIVGLGFTTILLFVGLVLYMRTRVSDGENGFETDDIALTEGSAGHSYESGEADEVPGQLPGEDDVAD